MFLHNNHVDDQVKLILYILNYDVFCYRKITIKFHVYFFR
jgi:hypothetical protein